MIEYLNIFKYYIWKNMKAIILITVYYNIIFKRCEYHFRCI